MSEPRRTDLAARIASALSSPAVSTFVGLVGVAVPVWAWLSSRAAIKNVLFGVETLLLLAIVANYIWLRRVYVQLRRASGRGMSDARYFDLIRIKLEAELIDDFEEIADGHLQIYAGDVPRVSVMLYETLIDSSCDPKRILAVDLTTNPTLLGQRREYLRVNRKLIEAGGTIQRLFCCWADDLVREDFVRPLLALVDRHRSFGVHAGLAVRNRLSPEQEVDFVVVARGAVLIEDEQGDADYIRGRSAVRFKGVDRWIGRFESMWGYGSTSAPLVLQAYDSAVRPMLNGGTWDAAAAMASLAHL
jgi:hypothetical protein